MLFCFLPDLSFMEESGIYRIIFKNKVKAELSEKCVFVYIFGEEVKGKGAKVKKGKNGTKRSRGG